MSKISINLHIYESILHDLKRAGLLEDDNNLTAKDLIVGLFSGKSDNELKRMGYWPIWISIARKRINIAIKSGKAIVASSFYEVKSSSPESKVNLSNPKVIKVVENKRFTKDQRRKFNWVVVEYRGDDRHEYRKGFYFERGMTTKEMDNLIPRQGNNLELSKLSEEAFYKTTGNTIIGSVEFVIWGISKGKKHEVVLHTKSKTKQEAIKIQKILEKEYGCKKCRIQELDLSAPPDFTNTINPAFRKIKSSVQKNEPTEFGEFIEPGTKVQIGKYRGELIKSISGKDQFNTKTYSYEAKMTEVFDSGNRKWKTITPIIKKSGYGGVYKIKAGVFSRHRVNDALQTLKMRKGEYSENSKDFKEAIDTLKNNNYSNDSIRLLLSRHGHSKDDIKRLME